MRQDIQNTAKRELTEAQRQLVSNHLPLAYAIAWRMKDCGVCLDDLRQEGCLGLCEAAMRFGEDAGNSFATYASHWCRKMMLIAIHHNTATDSLDDNTAHEPEDDDLLRSGQQRRIDDAMRCLDPVERQIIGQFYGINTERLSLTEIAAGLGFSRARASSLHQRALRRLETELRKHPLADYLTPWLC